MEDSNDKLAGTIALESNGPPSDGRHLANRMKVDYNRHTEKKLNKSNKEDLDLQIVMQGLCTVTQDLG
jgi:hypothetical protein